MKKFLSLVGKNNRIVVGILSGTSVDGIDTVLVKIKGNGVNTNVEIIDFKTYPVRSDLKKFIKECSSDKSGNVGDICKLNFLIGDLFADSVIKLIRKNKLLPKDIDLIGSHGQTIYHFPFNRKLFSQDSMSTLQIGELSLIANKTRIVTVGDFRTADIAVKGQGAPLVPYLDFILFSSKLKSRALINIGGISNITFLKKSGSQNEVVAFDSGPGNIILDYLSRKYFKKDFDKNGITASQGKVNNFLFEMICKKDKYYRKNFPKSTGREYYSVNFTEDIIKNFKGLDKKDILMTFTKFTAFTIFENLKKFMPEEIIISGGGAKNRVLMNSLKEYFNGTEVRIMNDNGIDCDNKEAVLFAVLANELISGNKTNMPSVTGSQRNVYLGKICIV